MTQLRLAIEKPGHGGRRDGAGRPPLARRAGLPHRSRPAHKRQHPVHVTWRFVRGLPSLRKLALARVLGLAIRRNTEGQLRRASSFRTIHFSIQPNHLHLIVEAGDARALTAGLRGLGIWLARRLNTALGRDGRVLADRYHSRELRSPREVRTAIVYVLQNHRHHAFTGRAAEHLAGQGRLDALWRPDPLRRGAALLTRAEHLDRFGDGAGAWNAERGASSVGRV